ncbi:MAG: TPM domain-containing protein, partial [Methanococcaceae archaeon]
MKKDIFNIKYLFMAVFLTCFILPFSSFAAWGNSESNGDYIKSTNSLNGMPEPTNNYVNDYANVITDANKESIKSMLKSVESQTKTEIVVVTINSVSDYRNVPETETVDYSINDGITTTVTSDEPAGTTESIEEFALDLFNTWGIGDKEKNNGILILVAVEDRRCRIQLGGGYG